jgi:hypothetical protein
MLTGEAVAFFHWNIDSLRRYGMQFKTAGNVEHGWKCENCRAVWRNVKNTLNGTV